MLNLFRSQNVVKLYSVVYFCIILKEEIDWEKWSTRMIWFRDFSYYLASILHVLGYWYLQWLYRKPMCSTSFLFLTSCELWVYGYTLSVGMFNCFSFICYQLASACFFESMVMVDLSSLFWQLQAQKLSNLFLLEKQAGVTNVSDGFKYSRPQIVCRKLSTLLVISVLMIYFYSGKWFILFREGGWGCRKRHI